MKKLSLAIACLLLLAAPAHAQKTKAVLTTEVNTNWPDNNVGAITPALLRSTVIDIINSYFDFGGASSFTCPTNQWISQVTSLADNIICAQPGFNQLSNYQQNEVSNVDLALVPAYTIKGNPTATNPATPADFTLNSLASKVSPANTDLLFLGDSVAVGPNGGYALKSVPWSSLPGVVGAVTSLNGLTGGLSLVANNGLALVVATPNLTLSLTAARRTLPTHQVFLSGSGTYTTPANALWIEITLVGAGGGGGGGNQATPGNNGGDTCWNTTGAACTTPVYDSGGGGGSSNSTPGAGGAISGSGTCDWSVPGGRGSGGSQSAAVNGSGGAGGNSSLGGGGGGGFNAVGTAAATNSGSGGGGGAATATTTAASGYGGSAGATCHVIINGPAGSYTYAVGAAGSHAAGGTNGDAGGDGALGQIIVYEHYGS